MNDLNLKRFVESNKNLFGISRGQYRSILSYGMKFTDFFVGDRLYSLLNTLVHLVELIDLMSVLELADVYLSESNVFILFFFLFYIFFLFFLFKFLYSLLFEPFSHIICILHISIIFSLSFMSFITQFISIESQSSSI